MQPTPTLPPSHIAFAKGVMTQYFPTTQAFSVATETFLNEWESAAMPGMSSLSTMFTLTSGTSIQAFHNVHWLCDGEGGVDKEFTVGYL